MHLAAALPPVEPTTPLPTGRQRVLYLLLWGGQVYCRHLTNPGGTIPLWREEELMSTKPTIDGYCAGPVDSC